MVTNKNMAKRISSLSAPQSYKVFAAGNVLIALRLVHRKDHVLMQERFMVTVPPDGWIQVHVNPLIFIGPIKCMRR